MYSIIDIETTGGNSPYHRITEIAVLVHDGEKVVDEFTSLINPERNIPYNITRITGITNEMVENAPKFYEVAKRIVEMTEGNIFVAHNVGFDYGFVQQEFKTLGYTFTRPNLCTVKLSRALIPGLPSYSLGRLCQSIGIDIKGRHRAAGDAYATAELFNRLISTDKKFIEEKSSSPEFSLKGLHPKLDKKTIQQLPEDTGIYYFYNEEGNLIYIGKSRNIHSRVIQHLANHSSKKGIDMRNSIAAIDFEITGSELVALLKESNEIKKHKPIYNWSQRRSVFNHGILLGQNEGGYITMKAGKINPDDVPVAVFTNKREAEKHLHHLTENYRLCQKLNGLDMSNTHCFSYSLKQCNGACIGKEPVEVYNKRADEAIKLFGYSHPNFLIIEEGRSNTEKAIVQIENGRYKGFGFADTTMDSPNLESLVECIKNYPDNRDIHQIISGYMMKNRVKVVKY